MTYYLRIGIALLLTSLCIMSPAVADDAAIAAALAHESRSAEDRERDARSKPAEVLALLDLQPGDAVIDLFGGGGYYADIMLQIVGPDGAVILQNNTPYMKFVEELVKEKYTDSGDGGVVLLQSEVDDLHLKDNTLDAALMVMSYHDLYYYNPERGWGNTDVPLFLSQVHAALKEGGKLLIVDHAAEPGSGKTAAQTVHRLDEEFARQEIEANGFRFVASSDALRNPDDDYSKMVFDKSVRGTTDRFIMLFQKN